MATKILILHGPNLDRLGKRQPEVYGRTTLADVNKQLEQQAAQSNIAIECRQSNSEAELVEWIHQAADQGQSIIINPGGLTHTSVVLRDALAEIADGAGFIEVHISNIHAREAFRHTSLLSPLASGIIAGCGISGYRLALDYAIERSQQAVASS